MFVLIKRKIRVIFCYKLCNFYCCDYICGEQFGKKRVCRFVFFRLAYLFIIFV